jgi:hypothetical protein
MMHRPAGCKQAGKVMGVYPPASHGQARVFGKDGFPSKRFNYVYAIAILCMYLFDVFKHNES